MLSCRAKQVPDVHVKNSRDLTKSFEVWLHDICAPLADGCRISPNLFRQPLRSLFLLYQYHLQAIDVTLWSVTNITRIIDITDITHISISLRFVQSYK